MGDVHELGDVDIFTVGTQGRPGQRVFFLQARLGRRQFTVKCEKQQAEALANYLDQLLTDLPAPDDVPLPVQLELGDPVEPLFVLGGIGVAWDQAGDRVVLSLEEVIVVDAGDDRAGLGDDDGDRDDLDPDDLDPDLTDRATMQLRITRGQALAFARRGVEVVSAGRPPCRFCGLPLDPDGHPCPRMN